MKAYSTDLRERVVASVENGECNIPEAARRYKVSEPSIERWVARYRETGSCAPLQELCEALEKKTKIKSSTSMVWRELVRLKLPRKKSRFMPASETHRR